MFYLASLNELPQRRFVPAGTACACSAMFKAGIDVAIIPYFVDMFEAMTDVELTNT